MDFANISDLIYEAAIVPERWKAVLDRAAREVDAIGGVLFTLGSTPVHAVHSNSLAGVWDEVVNGGWAARNPLPSRLLALGSTSFIHDGELVPEAERSSHPWFSEFTEKWQIGHSFGTRIDVPNGGSLLLSLERSTAKGPYGAADIAKFEVVRPDLGRAAALTSQLLFQQYDSTTSILNAIGLAGAVVSSQGRVLSSNGLFESLMPAMFQDRISGLSATSKAADALMQQALQRLKPEHWVGVSASIPIPPKPDAHPPAVMHIVPIRGLAQDIIHSGTAIIVVSTLDGTSVPSEALLRGLFDLTGAESRVANALVRKHGRHTDVATELGVSYETIRSHSKAIYQKTGLSNAAELIAVVGKIKVG